MKRDPATQRQVQAADPGQSTWLSANAGSGKTRVLTDRVARLLLNHTDPQNILCLTYTKAAASEMQNRLFKRLGEWAMLDDKCLRKRLAKLGVDGRIEEKTLRDARRLFAGAIETPGGLKIQTIHSFCAGLLRRFPLEAGVSPQFVEMDEQSIALLHQDVLDDIAAGLDAPVFDAFAARIPGEDMTGLTREIARHRAAFIDDPDPARVWSYFDLPTGFGEQHILDETFLGGEAQLLSRLLPALTAGSDTDRRAAAKISQLLAGDPSLRKLEILEGVFLTGASAKEPFSAKIGSFPTKKTRESISDILPELNAFMARVKTARTHRIALAAAERTLALHRFASVFLPLYAERKMRHAWLDFDDLILKTRDLLAKPGVADWVLYRLDGRIDHILVDEAQDTSPVQWQVIDLLTREFTSGEGARSGVDRTIFVVGDKKQSIYSFQGADPDMLDRMHEQFAKRLEGISQPLRDEVLEFSFRSSEAILGLVDCTFREGAWRGVGGEFRHRAFHQDMPGRADLWPVIDKTDSATNSDWSDPVDMVPEQHHDAQLAARIAGEIRRMIEDGESLWEKRDGTTRRRPVRAGDFLILVQRRSPLFHEIIRACKSEGLPIAGADRLKIGGELAVKDLTALLAFLALPEDSLSLAAALRSPLFGLDEAAIYDLAANRREKFLWETLRNRKAGYSETVSVLEELRRDADFLRPYDLIERVLTRHGGRRKLIAQLGEEAEDGIDALLAQALDYERVEVPSLTGFLVWLESGEVEIKRQPDAAGDRIRVMTVHGAKGLEAPIVILPDTGRRKQQSADQVLVGEDGFPIWKSPSNAMPPQISDLRDAAVQRQEEERERLLYVAMTRAEQWLIACAAGDLGNGESWYQRIEAGMRHVGAHDQDFGFGHGLRHQTGEWRAPTEMKAETSGKVEPLPEWARRPAIAPARPVAPLSPSDLGGAKIVAGAEEGLDEASAKRRGTGLHLLLEHLPDCDRAEWPAVADALLKAADDAYSEAEISEILAETETVLTAPALRPLFTRSALVEVGISATLQGRRMAGVIDRLIVESDHVLAIDYKSNAQVPSAPGDVPEGLLRQMGAYAEALAQIYPEREIRTAILWTRTASLMPLSSQVVAAALLRATTS